MTVVLLTIAIPVLIVVSIVAAANLIARVLVPAAAPTPGPVLDDVWDWAAYFAGDEVPINPAGANAEAVLAEAERIVEEASRG